jgi:hypothetical protein
VNSRASLDQARLDQSGSLIIAAGWTSVLSRSGLTIAERAQAKPCVENITHDA